MSGKPDGELASRNAQKREMIKKVITGLIVNMNENEEGQ
jgi:hypothetical protein